MLSGTIDTTVVLFLLLLHSMNRDMLRSIIAGTVEFDNMQGTTAWYDRPSDEDVPGAGAYVVGLAVRNTGGILLTVREMEKLAQGLEDYIEGAKKCLRGSRTKAQVDSEQD